MQYPPIPQRKSCDCSDPCISTDDVYYAGPNLPNSGVNTSDLLTEVIEKLDAIYAVPTLQKVTEAGNYTTLPIIADSFVKIGGDGNNILLDDGTVLPIGDLPIPIFNPSDYDLDEFTNTGIDPFAHVSDIPAAPGLQQVLGQGNSFTDNQMTAYDPVSDTNTYIRPYGFTFQRDYDLTEYTYNGVHFTTMGGLDVKSNMLNPKRETIGSATYIFPEKPSGTYTLATLDDIPAAPYKVYTALLTQVGTSDPTAIVLENTIGTITLSRNSTGSYYINSPNLFTVDKTFTQITSILFGDIHYLITYGNISRISVVTSNAATTFLDGKLDNTPIEIRVYN
jgi:hypothetical protein